MKNSIYSILKGQFLTSEDSFKNWRVILYVSVLALVMIGSSHSADKKVHDIARLNNRVKELRSEFVEGRTRLMRLKMESRIMLKMNKEGLQTSTIPPRKIIVKSKQHKPIVENGN